MDKLRKVGVFWRNTKEGAKSKGHGSLTINGMKQDFVMLTNKYKEKSSDPHFTLLSSNEPEVDEWATKQDDKPGLTDDDIPF